MLETEKSNFVTRHSNGADLDQKENGCGSSLERHMGSVAIAFASRRLGPDFREYTQPLDPSAYEAIMALTSAFDVRRDKALAHAGAGSAVSAL